MIPQEYRPQIDLALADEYPVAQAFVVISAVPRVTQLLGGSPSLLETATG
jgi:holo-[acyl-carrier protein] synthase